MPSPNQDQTLLAVSVGVVLFTIIAIFLFVTAANSYLFYACALIVMALAFYLSYNLSKSKDEPQQGKRKK